MDESYLTVGSTLSSEVVLVQPEPIVSVQDSLTPDSEPAQPRLLVLVTVNI